MDQNYTMNKIDLKKIIEDQGLNIKEVALELFPTNKYSKLALDRVIRGEAFLDSNQISKLSSLTRIPIQFLFSEDKWEKKAKDKMVIFTSGNYRAELNTSTNVTRIFHETSLFHESLLHTKSIPLNEYLSELEQIIIKYNKS